MQVDPEVIFNAASQLSEADRLTLAARLLDSVPDDTGGLAIDDPDLLAKLDARFADLSGIIPWEQLRDQL